MFHGFSVFSQNIFFGSNNILKIFLETTLVRFSKFATTLRYTILDSRFPPENSISEGRPPLCNSSSEAGALPSDVRIESDSDRKFLSQKFLNIS